MKPCPNPVCVPLRIYVTGPLGPKEKIEENVYKAEKISQMIAEKGHIPFCPHSMYKQWLYNNVLVSQEEEIIKRVDFSWIRVSDAMFLLPGWGVSRGALMETSEAIKCELWFFDSIESLPEVVPNKDNIYMMNRFDAYSNHRRRRLIIGATEYGDDWQTKDSLASAQEECYDLDNYPFLEYLKLERMRAKRDGIEYPPEE